MSNQCREKNVTSTIDRLINDFEAARKFTSERQEEVR